MFKQKYIVFIVFGLALGIGLFGFIAYSIKNDSSITHLQATPQRVVLAGEVEADIETTVDDKSAGPHIKTQSIDVETVPITEREKNFALLFEHRKQQDDINDLKEELAKERWAEFVKNQPHELSALIFDMQADSANQSGEAFTDKSYYLKHFENEPSAWGEQANYALESYFLNNVNGKANILRIDCRSSMCEIAGQLKNIQVDSQNYLNAKNQLVQRWNEISSEMPNSNALMQLFVLNGKRGLNYALPAESGNFSVPFSIFIYRNYRSSPESSQY